MNWPFLFSQELSSLCQMIAWLHVTCSTLHYQEMRFSYCCWCCLLSIIFQLCHCPGREPGEDDTDGPLKYLCRWWSTTLPVYLYLCREKQMSNVFIINTQLSQSCDKFWTIPRSKNYFFILTISLRTDALAASLISCCLSLLPPSPSADA